MAPLHIPTRGLTLTITAQPLTPDAFAPFGDVVENPRPDLHPSKLAADEPLPFDAVAANQGSAIKYQHVTRMANRYDDHAPSRVPGTAVVNMFVCASRPLRGGRHFEVNLLERHPYTTQTFTPLSTTAAAAATATSSGGRYLVIVAPDVAPAAGAPPDLAALRAFVATTRQAVTYGAGTWHAPMVALGPEGSTVDFVVTQFANGVGAEDCQEVAFGGAPGEGSILVEVPPPPSLTATASRL